MKIIIAGSRQIADYNIIVKAIEKSNTNIKATEIVSGGADGVDQLGEYWAVLNNIPTKIFLPDWDQFGKAAGPIRNKQMAQYADALLAIWDGKSRGTKNMIDLAKQYGLKVYVYYV